MLQAIHLCAWEDMNRLKKTDMKKIGLFYGSSSGNTQRVAGVIARELGIDKGDVFDIAKATPELLAGYHLLVLGSSTWGLGDLQDDWEGFIKRFERMNLEGKKVAVFGTGDSSSYPDTFCESVGIIADAAEKAGAALIGTGMDTSDYSYDVTRAEREDGFCGLLLDEDNESDKSPERIKHWAELLKGELN